MIVVDASALIEVLLNTPSGYRITQRLFDEQETLHVPCLLRTGITDNVWRVVKPRPEPRLLVAATLANNEDVGLGHLATGHGDPKASAKRPGSAVGATRRRPRVLRCRALEDEE